MNSYRLVLAILLTATFIGCGGSKPATAAKADTPSAADCVNCTGSDVGCWPIWPAPNREFWDETACWISLVVIPSEAIRSGFIQMRIA